MANNVAIITFNSVPNEDDSLVLISHMKVPPFTETPKGEIFKPSRTGLGTASIGLTTETSASNYASALTLDYGNDFAVSVSGNVVTIVCKPEGDFDYFITVAYGAFASFELVSASVAITGLENDYYLINNPININLSASVGVESFSITMENLSNQKTTVPVTVYPSPSGISKLEISGYIKSVFSMPADAPTYQINDEPTANSNSIKITVTSGALSQEITKTFIRGGNRTNDTNQFLSVGDICRPTDLLPIWDGYPTADYYLDDDGQVRKKFLFIPEARQDRRRKKGCNEIYVKFLNQKGGYCHWLFESHQNTDSGNAIGSYYQNDELQDLGVNADSKVKITGKIPEYYKGYANDLIVSPEIYVMKDFEFVRIASGKNTFTYDNIKRSYSVTINLDYDYRYNPSLLWD